MEWLVPICLFWTLVAMYLGGWPVEVVGGGAVRQLTGIFNSFILYLAFWGGLRALLGGMGGLLWVPGITMLAPGPTIEVGYLANNPG